MTDNVCGYRKPKPEITPANLLPGDPAVDKHLRPNVPARNVKPQYSSFLTYGSLLFNKCSILLFVPINIGVYFWPTKELNLAKSPYEKKTNLFCNMSPGNVPFIKIGMGATGRRHPSPIYK